jgi:hypothetical protein
VPDNNDNVSEIAELSKRRAAEIVAETKRRLAELPRCGLDSAGIEREINEIIADAQAATVEINRKVIVSIAEQKSREHLLRKLGFDFADIPLAHGPLDNVDNIGIPLDEVDNIAMRLRTELGRLRDEQKNGGSPVRRRKTLAEIEIAELAVTILKLSLPPAARKSNLVQLLEELLKVDRHRVAFAARAHTERLHAASLEAKALIAGDKIGAKKIAKFVGVSSFTVVEWRKSDDYRKLVSILVDLSKTPPFKGLI